MIADTDQAVIGLTTLQFAWGGLINARPVDQLVHLVRRTKRGTPGPTLCGIDRLADDAPGWSVGGGVTGPDLHPRPCPRCLSAAWTDFAGLPIRDTTFRLDWIPETDNSH